MEKLNLFCVIIVWKIICLNLAKHRLIITRGDERKDFRVKKELSTGIAKFRSSLLNEIAG